MEEPKIWETKFGENFRNRYMGQKLQELIYRMEIEGVKLWE